MINQIGDQTGPTRLMRSSDSPTIFTVKVFVEQDQIPVLRLLIEGLIPQIDRSFSPAIFPENTDQIGGYALADLSHGPLVFRLIGVWNRQFIPKMLLVFFQGLNDEIINRKPNWATPVGVSAVNQRSGFTGIVGDAVIHAVDVHVEWLRMNFGKRADPVITEKFVGIDHGFNERFHPFLGDQRQK